MARTKGHRHLIEADLETLPLMGLFVVLIPMLLLSAVFLEITVVNMSLPGDEADAEPAPDPWVVSVRIRTDAYLVEAPGTAARSIPRDDPAARASLVEALRSLREGRPDEHAVHIFSGPEVRYEEIILVMDLSREAGLTQAALVGGA